MAPTFVKFFSFPKVTFSICLLNNLKKTAWGTDTNYTMMFHE